jgi:hypothetical protein
MLVLELCSESSLPRWSIDEGLQIRGSKLAEGPTASDARARRSSPIHQLVQKAPSPDLTDGSWFIHLLVPSDAFSILGKISRRAYLGLEIRTWFGIGLAAKTTLSLQILPIVQI